MSEDNDEQVRVPKAAVAHAVLPSSVATSSVATSSVATSSVATSSVDTQEDQGALATAIKLGELKTSQHVAKLAYHSLWANEIKQALLAKVHEKILETLLLIDPVEISAVRQRYQELYGTPLIEALETTLQNNTPQFNQAVFILQGQLDYAHALALNEALCQHVPDPLQALRRIIEAGFDMTTLSQAFEKLTHQTLADRIRQQLDGDVQEIALAFLQGELERANVLWLRHSLEASSLDYISIEELCLNHTFGSAAELNQAFSRYTGLDLFQLIERTVPNDLLKIEIQALVMQQFTEAHATRIRRLITTNTSITNSQHLDAVYNQMTQLLILHSIKPGSQLSKIYREMFHISLHDDMLAFLDSYRNTHNDSTKPSLGNSPTSEPQINLVSARLLEAHSNQISTNCKIPNPDNQLLALVNTIDPNQEYSQPQAYNLASSTAKWSSYIAALLSFTLVETLDYYLDNISPSISFSIAVAIVIGIIAESVVRPYLESHLMRADKLVAQVHKRRSEVMEANAIESKTI